MKLINLLHHFPLVATSKGNANLDNSDDFLLLLIQSH
jgi:hypothetical protein